MVLKQALNNAKEIILPWVFQLSYVSLRVMSYKYKVSSRNIKTIKFSAFSGRTFQRKENNKKWLIGWGNLLKGQFKKIIIFLKVIFYFCKKEFSEITVFASLIQLLCNNKKVGCRTQNWRSCKQEKQQSGLQHEQRQLSVFNDTTLKQSMKIMTLVFISFLSSVGWTNGDIKAHWTLFRIR